MNNLDPTNSIRDYLDESNDNKEERLNKIADLIHLLNFERRLTELTEDESKAMMNVGSADWISEGEKKKMKDCKTDEERDALSKEVARGVYFVQCAWSDYLNGISEYKPYDSKREAARMWDVLQRQTDE